MGTILAQNPPDDGGACLCDSGDDCNAALSSSLIDACPDGSDGCNGATSQAAGATIVLASAALASLIVM